jgi:hypothetical protein
VTNIEQTPGGSLYEYAYVGDGQEARGSRIFTSQTIRVPAVARRRPRRQEEGRRSPDGARRKPSSPASQPAPTMRASSAAAMHTFSASEGSAVSFDSNQNLAELSMPGFALLPDYAIRGPRPAKSISTPERSQIRS